MRLTSVSEAIRKKVNEFRLAIPYATVAQAREKADELFDNPSDRNGFFIHWKERKEFDSNIKQAESKTTTDRNWPESKGY